MDKIQIQSNPNRDSSPPVPESNVPRSRSRKYDATSVQYLNDDELAALFVAIGGSVRDRALFEVAFHRGLRASEVGKLTVADVRLHAKRIYVHRLKGGHSGEYPLTTREVKALRAWLTERGDAPGPLFVSPRRSREGCTKPLGRSRLDQLIKHYGAVAGLPESKRHFHCLRHTAGTKMGELSGDPAEVQDHLGHRDIRSTMVYLKVTNKRRTRLGETLSDRW